MISTQVRGEVDKKIFEAVLSSWPKLRDKALSVFITEKKRGLNSLWANWGSEITYEVRGLYINLQTTKLETHPPLTTPPSYF